MPPKRALSSRGSGTAAGASRSAPAEMVQSRVDQLVTLIDHCTAAKATADELDERLLGYLLAMAIQEARGAVRHRPAGPKL